MSITHGRESQCLRSEHHLCPASRLPLSLSSAPGLAGQALPYRTPPTLLPTAGAPKTWKERRASWWQCAWRNGRVLLSKAGGLAALPPGSPPDSPGASLPGLRGQNSKVGCENRAGSFLNWALSTSSPEESRDARVARGLRQSAGGSGWT